MSARVHEMASFRNRHHVFEDRFEAGKVLARMLLTEFKDREDAIVLAIPSGGVPVGLTISRELQLPFDLMLVRKLQIPGNTEAGFGALTLDGSLFLNQELLAYIRLSEHDIEQERRTVEAELQKRNQRFRGGAPPPVLENKTVLLADDGLASGFTMMASIHSAKRRKAKSVVVAVPTAPLRTIGRIQELTDAVYCPNIREEHSFAVAAAYKFWYDLSHEDVLELLDRRGEPDSPGLA
ncbi:phosphoribosyltransferase [Desulfatiglans anilini]|uniref:phosphoribosyltransferase n=1 Tax=Desulfatiglans anilini TaxID=90728 RepID=UPI00040C45F8|nr:phosphoribosyltransferase family protein [Desulfatiglans anilini]